MEMKPEVAKMWADALASGEYEQTSGVLCHEDSEGKRRYCCLGVLCELAIKAGVQVTVERSDNSGYVAFNGELSYLPLAVQEWADLSASPIIGDVSATAMNDRLHLSFDLIADEIRTHLIQKD